MLHPDIGKFSTNVRIHHKGSKRYVETNKIEIEGVRRCIKVVPCPVNPPLRR